VVTRSKTVKRTKTRAKPPEISRSSGNVFADLGFEPDEAEHLRIRSTLMATVRQVIVDRKMTQAEAADLFEVKQPRISDLMRGKINLFSIDTLVDMLARADIRVEVRTKALK
jgi:predicted XRE-type DNA-binding protein